MKKSLFPDKKAFAELQEAAENIASRKFNQMGYPFDQDTGFSEFYRWLADTGLCDITLINVGDPYKKNWDMLNTDKFERFCIDFMADACGFEGNHWGVLSNGGTDGNMHGIYFGRKALAAKSPLPPILYVSEEAHYSVKKLGDIQNIETRIVGAKEMGSIDAEDLERKLDPSRPALVAVAVGGTFKGAIDSLAEIDLAIESRKPVAVYRHLDAALFGGYLPFMDDPAAKSIIDAKGGRAFDSIAISGHKFLGLNEPAGIFICSKDTLSCVHESPVAYLNGVIPTISCSRSGFDALKLYWHLSVLGREGLKEQADHSLKMAGYLQAKLKENGVRAWRNDFSNTVFFERPGDEVVSKYALACNEYPVFGKLAHVVAMQYFTEEIADAFAADAARR